MNGTPLRQDKTSMDIESGLHQVKQGDEVMGVLMEPHIEFNLKSGKRFLDGVVDSRSVTMAPSIHGHYVGTRWMLRFDPIGAVEIINQGIDDCLLGASNTSVALMRNLDHLPAPPTKWLLYRFQNVVLLRNQNGGDWLCHNNRGVQTLGLPPQRDKSFYWKIQSANNKRNKSVITSNVYWLDKLKSYIKPR